MDYEEKLRLDKKRNYQIRKSNDLVRKARYSLKLSELKTLAYIFSMIKPDDTIKTIYIFSISEYCKICEIDETSGYHYQEIKQNLKALRDKSFFIINAKGEETTVGWLDKVWISPKKGTIKVRLDEDLESYVIGVINNFTQYELLSTLPMRSKYSFRLYELLKSYSFTKMHTFDIDELKDLLDATKYSNFKDFRVKVLKIALKEINAYTDIEISYETVKQGRKIIKVKFLIKKKTMRRI